MTKVNMIKTKPSNTRLRRLAIISQGLHNTSPFGKGESGTLNTIKHLGYVQLDSISVIQRAHHHVLSSRIPNYTPEFCDNLLAQRCIFEYWAHAAAFLPIDAFRYSLPYKHAIKSGQKHWYKNPDRKLMQELLARIKIDGPLRARDISKDINTGDTKQTGWWDWKPAKKALEQLYMEGDLMVSSRDGFQKSYDLTERVLPDSINTNMPNDEEMASYLLNQQLNAYGFTTLKGITYLRRNPALRKAAKTLVLDKLNTGELIEINVGNDDSFFVNADAFEQSANRISHRMRFLSPFDNLVIQRERLKNAFNYHFQLECYLPEDKRKYGYFSLPILYKDAFIGRMDCKAHRKIKLLEIKALHVENLDFDLQEMLDAFVKAIRPFIDFQACNSLILNQVYPHTLEQAFQDAIKVIT